MIEKIRAVSNPLTIIAIFAALAEVAGTVSLLSVDRALQSEFIWFVMLFPTLLVTGFLFILYRKPSVLYAPSDFKDEQNFIVAHQSAKLSVRQIDQVEDRLRTATDQIRESLAKFVENDSARESIGAAIASQITPIQTEVAEARRGIDSALQSLVSRNEDIDLNQKLTAVRLLNSWINPQSARRGNRVEITYEIESLHSIPDGVWLGASFTDGEKRFIHSTSEDQRIYLCAGRAFYRRILSIPSDVRVGSYSFSTNVWYGPVANGKDSRRLNSAGANKNQIQIVD